MLFPRKADFLVFLGVILGSICSCTGNRLKWKKDSSGKKPRFVIRGELKPGKYKETIRSVVEDIISTRVEKCSQRFLSTYDYEVTIGKPDGRGRRKVITRLERVVLETGNGKFDTSKPETMQGCPFAGNALSIIGREVEITLGKGNEVLGADGMDGFVDMKLAMDMLGACANRRFKDDYRKQVLKDLVNFTRVPAPSYPVGVGAVWHVNEPLFVPLVGEMAARLEFELLEVRDKGSSMLVIIGERGEIMIDKPKTVNIGKATMTIMEMDIFLRGSREYDMGTGISTRSEEKMNGYVIVRSKVGKKEVCMKIEVNTDRVVRTVPVD